MLHTKKSLPKIFVALLKWHPIFTVELDPRGWILVIKLKIGETFLEGLKLTLCHLDPLLPLPNVHFRGLDMKYNSLET